MKITILEEEIEIRFCIAVELAYEEITGEPFDLKGLNKMKNSVALGMAAITVSNPDTQITVEKLVKEASGQEFAALNTAVVNSMTEWLGIPKVIEDAEKNEPQPDEGEQPKN